MSSKTGRPTKYRKRFIAEVDAYLAETGKEQMVLPTKQGFALRIGVDDDTLDNWANKKDDEGKRIRLDFFGALRKIMLTQATQLINDGIYGGKQVNSTIIKLLLENNHGMKERVDATSKDEKIELVFDSSLRVKDE